MFNFADRKESTTDGFKSDDKKMERGYLGNGYCVQDYESYERFADDCGQHFKSNKECEDYWNKFW